MGSSSSTRKKKGRRRGSLSSVHTPFLWLLVVASAVQIALTVFIFIELDLRADPFGVPPSRQVQHRKLDTASVPTASQHKGPSVSFLGSAVDPPSDSSRASPASTDSSFGDNTIDGALKALRIGGSLSDRQKPAYVLPFNSQPTCKLGNTLDGQHRLAIIVPFRESPEDLRSNGYDRESNLKEWTARMRQLLPQRIIDRSHVFVVEQTQGDIFNRGMLLNVGFDFVFSERDDDHERVCRFDYIVLHDVDQVPTPNTAQFAYDFQYRPVKMVAETTHQRLYNSHHARLPMYGTDIGGAWMIRPVLYRVVNGYSHMFPGWKGEDDNMLVRIRQVEDEPLETLMDGKFQSIYHAKIQGLNIGRLYNKKKSIIATEFETGLNTLAYDIKHVTDYDIDGWPITRLLVDIESPQNLPQLATDGTLMKHMYHQDYV